MKNKGITLIALIITIIIMLILVAVTVSYTVKSGLIGKTTKVRVKYEEETINEIVGASIVYKVTATTIKNTQYIDIPKTSVQIYKNLTANGFTILSETEEIDGETGIKLTSDKIDLKVQGKYAEYEGEIGATGITKKVAKVEKNKEDDNLKDVFAGKIFESLFEATYTFTNKQTVILWDNIEVPYTLAKKDGKTVACIDTSYEEDCGGKKETMEIQLNLVYYGKINGGEVIIGYYFDGEQDEDYIYTTGSKKSLGTLDGQIYTSNINQDGDYYKVEFNDSAYIVHKINKKNKTDVVCDHGDYMAVLKKENEYAFKADFEDYDYYDFVEEIDGELYYYGEKLHKEIDLLGRRLNNITKQDIEEIISYLSNCEIISLREIGKESYINIVNENETEASYGISIDLDTDCPYIWIDDCSGESDGYTYFVPGYYEEEEIEYGVWYKSIIIGYDSICDENIVEEKVVDGTEIKWPNISDRYTYIYEDQNTNVFKNENEKEGFCQMVLEKLLEN